MMFQKKKDSKEKTAFEGVTFLSPVYGAKTLISEFTLKAGVQVPEHSHPHEQTGYMVSGHMIFDFDGEKQECAPGDMWSIPGDMKHSVNVLEDSIVVEVFSPVREEYI